MKRLLIRMIFLLFGLFIVYTEGYSADALYRFMHNDHDALIIGEITHIDKSGIKVKVEKNIVSAKNLNEGSPRKQLKIKEAKVKPFSYTGFNRNAGARTVDPAVGDYVLLSLQKDGANFRIAWGAYRVDSLDYKKLSIILPDGATVWSKMEAAAIKVFVNSEGQITEFKFDGEKKTVYAGEKGIIIFQETDSGMVVPGPSKEAGDSSSAENHGTSIGVIGSADGPTAIYISGTPARAMIIPAIVIALIVFALGFVIGYKVKKG